jgi:hypothetical protein
LLLAHVAHIKRELSLDLPKGVFGKTDRTRFGQGFDPGSDVNPIAVNVAFVDD